jgi:hypothetical protein
VSDQPSVAAPIVSEPAATALRGRISWETGVLIAALVVGSVLILWGGRRLGFYFDDWTYVTGRQGGGFGTYLDPHNGHLSLIPIVIYKALFVTIGTDHYWPYRVVLLILHLVTCVELYVLVRRRLGARAALIPALLLIVMANSSENLLWAFQLDYVGSVATGLGAFLLLDRPSRRGDIWVCVLLAASLAFSSLGVAVLIGVAVELLMQRPRWRALWILVIPAVLYGLWTLRYGDPGALLAQNLAITTQYVADAAAGAAVGIIGLVPAWGAVLLVGGAAGVAIIRSGNPRAPLPSPRLAAFVVTVLSFWVLTALARAQDGEPNAPRYIYFGAVLLMLTAAWLLPRPQRWSPWATVTVGVLLGFVLLGNVYRLRDSERFFRDIWQPLRASLAGFEVAGPDSVAPTAPPSSPHEPSLMAGPYLAAVRDSGSPTGGVAWLTKASEAQRQVADSELVQIENVVTTPSTAAPTGTGTPPAVENTTNGRTVTRGGCDVSVPAAGGGATLTVRLAPGTAVAITTSPGSAVTVQARRFAEQFVAPPSSVAGGATALLRTPADQAPNVPWHLRVTASQRIRVCAT